MKRRVDGIIRGIGELLTLDGPGLPRRGAEMSHLGIVRGAAVAISGTEIAGAGPEDEVCAAFEADLEWDAAGGVVMPGFVDPHTHLLFAGTREGEFEQRLMGASYQEIAAAGGGIRSTVRTFREASDAAVVAESRKRLDRMLAQGTTTVEVKSGYGLSVEQEIRALKLIEELNACHPVECVATFMGAHEVPDECRDDHAGYVRLVVEEMLPRVARETRARFCDVFCEEGVFGVEETRQILVEARSRGLGLKVHADEFQPIGACELAGELRATSADHLIEADEHGLLALREGGTTAVLLPATSFSLGERRYAPARRMVQMEIPVAVATDCNPGSSMTESMPLVLALACLEMGLKPAEAIAASTVNAAWAIGLTDRGRVGAGLRADLQLLDAPSHVSVVYHLGTSHVRQVWIAGKPQFSRPS